MTIGIRYISHGDNSGYGLAALAYVRALHDLGVPVRWEPWLLGPQAAPWQPESGLAALPLAHAATRDNNSSDVPALIAATTRPIDYDTIVVHTLPEHWSRFAELGKRLVGYTTWETDAVPHHWRELLPAADVILVPSTFNATLFESTGIGRPVHAVPHIHRHAWSRAAVDDAKALRRRAQIPDDHFVFYFVGAWDPRKDVAGLIAAFVREFSARDKVTLLVKTSAKADSASLDAQQPMSLHEITFKVVDRVCGATGREPPNVSVLAVDNMSARTLDAIHAASDAYVSLSHGEAWGMGAFEAATLGKPVIITGWGGQLDYLGADYPGLLRYEMAPVSGWLPEARYQPPQRWAHADTAQFSERLRAAASGNGELASAAARVKEEIASRYSESSVAQRFLAAVGG